MQINKETKMLISAVIQNDGGIELPAHGNSMFPLIREGNLCRFESCEAPLLKKGDIVLFYSPTQQLVAHRLYQLKSINHVQHYIFKGDTNLGYDEPIGQDGIVGKLIWIKRGGTIHHATAPAAYIWSKAIVAFPITAKLLRMYLNRKKRKASKQA